MLQAAAAAATGDALGVAKPQSLLMHPGSGGKPRRLLTIPVQVCWVQEEGGLRGSMLQLPAARL